MIIANTSTSAATVYTPVKYFQITTELIDIKKSYNFRYCRPMQQMAISSSWQFPTNSIDYFLVTYSKPQSNPYIYLPLFYSLKQSVPNHTFLYPDGSKTHLSCSFSVTTAFSSITRMGSQSHTQIYFYFLDP